VLGIQENKEQENFNTQEPSVTGTGEEQTYGSTQMLLLLCWVGHVSWGLGEDDIIETPKIQ
jgi:hypothetical protein